MDEFRHKIVAQYIDEKINAADREIQSEIDATATKVNNDTIARNRIPGEIQRIRHSALKKYESIKANFNTYILESVTKISPQSMKDEISEQKKKEQEFKTKRKQVEEEIQQIRVIQNESDYNKYLRFTVQKKTEGLNAPVRMGEKNVETDQKKAEDFYAPVRTAAKNVETVFNREKNKRFSRGLFLTLLFAVIDLIMIYSVFVASNIEETAALLSGIFTAVALDAPPFILGVLISRKRDLAYESDLKDPSWENRQPALTVGIVLSTAFTILFVLVYVGLRVMLFLGGGNFDMALHMVVSRTFDFQNIEFQGSELLSSFVPITTSVAAYAVSLVFYHPKERYFDQVIQVINAELEECLAKKSKEKIRYDNELERLEDGIKTLRAEIWGVYGTSRVCPKDDETFYANLSLLRMLQEAKLYPDIYRAQSVRLRGSAEEAAKKVNLLLAPISLDHNAAFAAKGNEEEALLNYAWNPNPDGEQHPDTVRTINAINNQIQTLTDIMDKKENEKKDEEEDGGAK